MDFSINLTSPKTKLIDLAIKYDDEVKAAIDDVKTHSIPIKTIIKLLNI